MITWWMAAARAQDLPAIAEGEGYGAAHDALVDLVARTRPKKLSIALESAGLPRMRMKVERGLGADLALTEAGPAQGCLWAADKVNCSIPLRSTAPLANGDYVVTCRSPFGASVPVASTLVEIGGRFELLLPDLGPCWKLDGETLVITPVAGAELEGMGAGTELIPPELVGLSKRQVDETIGEHTGAFRHCLVSKGSPGLTGKLVLDYHIGADGHFDEVKVASSTLGAPAVEACVIERFRAIAFPRPNDGYDRGSWPISFQ